MLKTKGEVVPRCRGQTVVRFGLLLVVPAACTGCWGATAAVTAAFVAIADDDGDDEDAPPLVEVLAPESGDLESGIIPIRYRIFDADRHARVISWYSPGGIMLKTESGPKLLLWFSIDAR